MSIQHFKTKHFWLFPNITLLQIETNWNSRYGTLRMDNKTLEKGPLNGRGSGQKITTHVFAAPVSAQDAESQLNEPNTGTYDVLSQPPAPLAPLSLSTFRQLGNKN
jgi:hypothetical protein